MLFRSMKALAAVVLTLCASSVLAAPIVINNAGYGGFTFGVFGSPAGATFPNTHHGQSFIASDTAYHSIGVDIEEVYGLGTRGFFDPGANFDMRFQVFAGVGTGGALLRTIDYEPGPGHDGWLDLEVTGIAFTNGGSYTATFSAADESGEHLWFGFLSSTSVYAGGQGIEDGAFVASRDHVFRGLDAPTTDGGLRRRSCARRAGPVGAWPRRTCEDAQSRMNHSGRPRMRATANPGSALRAVVRFPAIFVVVEDRQAFHVATVRPEVRTCAVQNRAVEIGRAHV